VQRPHLWLWIEQVELAGATGHEDKDDPFGRSAELGRFGCERIDGTRRRCAGIASQEIGQSDGA